MGLFDRKPKEPAKPEYMPKLKAELLAWIQEFGESVYMHTSYDGTKYWSIEVKKDLKDDGVNFEIKKRGEDLFGIIIEAKEDYARLMTRFDEELPNVKKRTFKNLVKAGVPECTCDEPGHTYNKKGDYANGLPDFSYCATCSGIMEIRRIVVNKVTEIASRKKNAKKVHDTK